MALEDTASLQLTIEVREALARIEELRAKYDAALKNMQAATKANLDPASAEFQHLLTQARTAGDELLAAGEKGRQALVKMGEQGANTGTSVRDLQAGIGVLRAQVTSLGSDGSKSFDIFSASADKAAVRLKSFAGGLVAGLAISTLTSLIDGATEGAKHFLRTVIEGEPVIADFGAKIQALDTTRAVVAERAARLEAEQVKAQTGTRLSLEEVAEAVSKRHRAMLSAERAYAKAISQSTDLRDITDAEAEKKRALADAEAEYTDTLRQGNLERERELDLTERLNESYDEAVSRKESILDAVVGDGADLEARATALLDVVATVKETGKVHIEVAENVTAELKKLTEEYESFGRPLPDALKRLRAEFPFLTDEQEKAAASLKKFADAQRDAAKATNEAADAVEKSARRDVFGRELDPAAAQAEVKALRERKEALEAETEDGIAALETFEELAQVKTDLAKAERVLSDALAGQAQSWQGAEYAAHGYEVAITRIADVGPAIGSMVAEADKAAAAQRAAAAAAGEHGEAIGEQARVTQQAAQVTERLGVGTVQYTQDVKSADAAIGGLAANQAKFNAESAAMAEAAKEAGLQAGTMAERVEELGRRIKQVEDQIVTLTAELGRAFSPEAVETWAAKVESRAIPVALQLKACLDSIE